MWNTVIIVSSTKTEAEFWSATLKNSDVIHPKTRVFSIFEDWAGGAGQLLGTLNALIETHLSLSSLKTTAIYHTAGKGTRIAPIGLTEAGKGAVKLPFKNKTITLLEAVIKQTTPFSKTRKGRLCVFWADAIFIPERNITFEGKHHIELFGIEDKIPDNGKKWRENWQSYGLIIPDGKQIILKEKQSWAELKTLAAKKILKKQPGASKNMGCFSISKEFLCALLEEFKKELMEKKGKLDTDPHLWMPLTSLRADFRNKKLWDRINTFKKKFLKKAVSPHAAEKTSLPHSQKAPLLIGAKNLGGRTFWWDFGSIKLFHRNTMKMLEKSAEGAAMRRFFEIKTQNGAGIKNSIVAGSKIRGKIENSIILSTRSKKLKAKNSIIINCLLKKGNFSNSIAYNCVELNNMEGKKSITTDIFCPGRGKIRLMTSPDRDGKKDWDTKIFSNCFSYSGIARLLKKSDPAETKKERKNWENYYRTESWKKFDALKNTFIKPQPVFVKKIWGGKEIGNLKSIRLNGKTGESWECSGYPGKTSVIKMGAEEIPLTHLLNYAPEEILGKNFAEYGGKMPVLVKFIDSQKDLSVQVHPDDTTAKKLGETEPGKNEAWLILKAEPRSVLYLGFRKKFGNAKLITAEHLSKIEAAPGDVFNIPAGTVHAIGKGILLLEIEQTSDLTYRIWDWNRIPARPLHLKKAQATIAKKLSRAETFKARPLKISSYETKLISTPFFRLNRLTLNNPKKIPTDGNFQILVCLKGRAEIHSGRKKELLKQGESILVPASIHSYEIKPAGSAEILKAQP